MAAKNTDFMDADDGVVASKETQGEANTQQELYGRLAEMSDWALFITLLCSQIGKTNALSVHRDVVKGMKPGTKFHISLMDSHRDIVQPPDGNVTAMLRYRIGVLTPINLSVLFSTLRDLSGGRLFGRQDFRLKYVGVDLLILRKACDWAAICFGKSKQRYDFEKSNVLPAIRWNIDCAIDDLASGDGGRLSESRRSRAVRNVQRASKLMEHASELRIMSDVKRKEVRSWIKDALHDLYADFRDPSFNRDMDSHGMSTLVDVFGLRLASDLTELQEERLSEAVLEANMQFSVKDMIADTLAKYGVTDVTKLSYSEKLRIQRELAMGRTFELIADENNSARDLAPLLKALMDRDHQEREAMLEQREVDIERAIGFFQTLAEHLDSWLQGIITEVEIDTGKKLSVRADPVSMLRKWMAGDPALMAMLGVGGTEMNAIEVKR